MTVQTPEYKIMPNETGEYTDFTEAIFSKKGTLLGHLAQGKKHTFRPINTRWGMLFQGNSLEVHDKIMETKKELEG